MTEYTGKENLDFLESLPNYINEVEGKILGFLEGKKTVLDFGAGTGTYARRLKAKGINVDCVEIDGEYIARLKDAGLNCFGSLEEAAPSYDRIYSCDVIEHIEDDITALKQLHAKLAAGGKIFLYVPAFNMLYSSMDKKVGHFRRYTKTDLVNKAKLAGFKITCAGYFDSVGFFGSLFFKYFGPSHGNISSPSIYNYYKWIFPVSRVLDKLGARFLCGKNLLVIAEK